MLNKVMLMGRLTHDPELKRTPGGTPVTTFSLAVDRDFRNQKGDKETDFIDIVAWRNTAEFVSRFLTKGRMAVVEGRLQLREYTDRDGSKRRVAEVIAEQVYFADSRREEAPSGVPAAAPGYAPAGRPRMVFPGEFAELEDEDQLPF